MVYYTNGFTTECNDYGYDLVSSSGGLEPHPNQSEAFYSDLLGTLKDQYSMQMLFTDFLCYRGPGMAIYDDVPPGEDGEHLWLAGIARAAASLNIEV